MQITKRVQELPGCKLLKNFNPALEADEELKQLKEEVNEYARSFPMPGRYYEP